MSVVGIEKGYIRFNTDDNGKIEDVEDIWFVDERAIDFYDNIVDLIEMCKPIYKPSSLILITFDIEETKEYQYDSWNYEYDSNLTITNEFILINNYTVYKEV